MKQPRAYLMKTARRIALLAASLLPVAAGAARAEGLSAGVWPRNPFAFTLSDEIFTAPEAPRFETAARIAGDGLATIGADLADIFTFPMRDPGAFAAYALGVGALVLIDRPTTIAYQETLVPLGKRINLPPLVDMSGWPINVSVDEQYVGAAVAGTWAYGVLANDERAQVAAMLSAKAFGYSYLTSHVLLKAAFGRNRPVPGLRGHRGPVGDYTTSPFDFFNAPGINLSSVTAGTGMPSFHFTMYYSTARVYAGVYDNWLVPYALATALALQSAEGHHHWVSDMVAGALIGTGIGNVVLSNYQDRRRERLGTLTPVVSSKGAGVLYQLRF
ncbi:MAG: phosphatase PAP2 family protein [Alphaproteobacteria bacterium]|nr:MAG: phosphatase PAP2 family protein [Alphaproteobacteria bacterium]